MVESPRNIADNPLHSLLVLSRWLLHELSMVADRECLWGYKPLYPHGSTWAAPSKVAQPTR